MYPASFDYHAPLELRAAVALLEELGAEAKVLAGGQSLLPLMKLRLAEPAHLVDLGRIGELRGIATAGDRLVLGAMVREAELEASPLVREHAPLLAETSRVIADPLVRNRATVGGNVAHADPGNDQPATMLACDATFELVGPGGARRVRAADFFLDLYRTALAEDEILARIEVPERRPGEGAAYEKLERQVGDFPVVAAAARVRLVDGRIADAAVALTNMGPTSVRASATEALLVGQAPDDALLGDAAQAALEGTAPWDELRGSAAYKRRVLPVVVRRALARAVARAAQPAAQA